MRGESRLVSDGGSNASGGSNADGGSNASGGSGGSLASGGASGDAGAAGMDSGDTGGTDASGGAGGAGVNSEVVEVCEALAAHFDDLGTGCNSNGTWDQACIDFSTQAPVCEELSIEFHGCLLELDEFTGATCLGDPACQEEGTAFQSCVAANR